MFLAALLMAAAPADARTRTLTYRIGPLTMGAYQTSYKSDSIRTPGIKGSISFMNAKLVDGKGRFVPQEQVMIHHVVFVNDGRFDGDRSQEYCGKGFKERFYGTGEEDQSMMLPPGYGYRVNKKDRWRASWMLMNHKPVTRKIYIEYTMTITDGWAATPVKPYWLGVEPCLRDPIFNVPGGGGKGSSYIKEIEWVPPVDGRIVAVGTHLHGGSKRMTITEPACGDRTIAEAVPQYGPASDPIYRVSPHIHEPSPRYVSYPMSAAGIPIRRGQRYRVAAIYDNERPHARVMGIMHAYVAPASGPKTIECEPLPTDTQTISWDKPFRLAVPQMHITLAVRGPDGRAKGVHTLPGRELRRGRLATVTIKGSHFSSENVSIKRGGVVRWRFSDPYIHDVTTANGPTAFGSQQLQDGVVWARRFNTPGTYSLYCTIHPLDMHQIVRVRP